MSLRIVRGCLVWKGRYISTDRILVIKFIPIIIILAWLSIWYWGTSWMSWLSCLESYEIHFINLEGYEIHECDLGGINSVNVIFRIVIVKNKIICKRYSFHTRMILWMRHLGRTCPFKKHYSHWVCSKHDFSSRKSTAELKSWPCSQPSIVRNLDYIRKRSISNQHCTKNSFWYDICAFWMQVWLNGTYRNFI